MPDVFLSHVGADKETYVRPLAEALMASGFTFWIDEAELRWGDSLMERISEGLHQSRCVIIFLSREFLERRWTRRELMWAMAIQDVEEGHKLLPLYIEDPSEVWKTYPIISHIRYLTWSDGLNKIVGELAAVLQQPVTPLSDRAAPESEVPSTAEPKQPPHEDMDELDYLITQSKLESQIQDLRNRSRAADSLGELEVATHLSEQASELEALLPIIVAGYDLLIYELLDIAVDACGEMMVPVDAEDVIAVAPPSVLNTWAEAKGKHLFDGFLLFGAAGIPDQDGEFQMSGGYILGQIGKHTFWVSSW